MMHRTVQRLLSLALSAILTVAMFGGIDQLSQVDHEPSAAWAARLAAASRG